MLPNGTLHYSRDSNLYAFTYELLFEIKVPKDRVRILTKLSTNDPREN